MLRSTMSRRATGITAAATIGAGLGLGALGLWSAAGAGTPQSPSTAPTPAAATAPAAPTSSVSSPLAADRASAIATTASPGRVIEVEQESDGPTGLLYEVTVQHADGTQTEVDVDAISGRVLSVQNDDEPDGH
jgi:Peptidase propeptide and YPEB domain